MDYFRRNRRIDYIILLILGLVGFVSGIWMTDSSIRDIELIRSDRYLDDKHVYCTIDNQNEIKNDGDKNAIQLMMEGKYVCNINNVCTVYDQAEKIEEEYKEILLIISNGKDHHVNFLSKIPSSNKEGFLVVAFEMEKPSEKDIDKINKMINAYYSGSKVDNDIKLSGTGSLVKLDKKEKKKIENIVKKLGLKELENSNIEYKFIYDKTRKSIGQSKLMISMAVIIYLLLVNVLIIQIKRNNPKHIFEKMSERGVDVEDVQMDLQNGKKYKNIYIGKKYAMGYHNGTKFIDGDNLAWVRPKTDVRKIRIFFIIPIHKTTYYLIEYFTFSGENDEILICKNKKEFEKIMSEFVAIAPGVLYGKNKEWSKLYRKDRQEFYRIARQSKYEAGKNISMDEYMNQFEARF